MMSLSVRYFNKIALDFKNITLKRPVLEGESQAFDEILKKRRKFCINNMHLAANLLDPQYMGKDLDPEEYVSAIFFHV